MSQPLFSRLLLGILLLLISLPALAQSTQTRLRGRISDQNGAAITGAEVTVRQIGSNYERTVTTNKEGRFDITPLPFGEYQLVIKQTGFETLQVTERLDAGNNENVKEFLLEPASVAEAVVITSSHILSSDELAERVPGSIDLIDAETLENSRALNSTEILRRIPGFNLRDEEGFGLRPNIGIRGLNPTRSTKVLLLEDGIPLTYAPYGDNSSYYHPPIDRFRSVEILKGSGQIAYGPQTIGGVVNYLTPNPPDTRAGSISLTGGNRSYFNGHINYGDTIGNTGMLLSFTRKQGQGSRENIRSGLNDFNFKSVSTFNAAHALTLKFNYYGEDSNATYSGLRENEFRANPRQNPFRKDFFYGDRFGAAATHAFVINPEVVLTTNVYGSYFRRHWWRQSSNSNERPNDASDPVCGGMANLNTLCGNQGRLRRYIFGGIEPRLRISKPLFGRSNELELGFRAHFEDQERIQKNGDRPTSRDGVVVENNERRNQAYSGFVQNTFVLGKLSITPGLRLEHIKYRRTNRLLNVTGNTELTQLVPGIGFSYHPSDQLTLFAGVHRGFAPPRTEDIINNTTGGSLDLDPELSWNYEVGLRARPHRALRLDATFFRMDYENQIVPASLAGGVGATFTNGGETLHQGIELATTLDSSSLLRQPFNFYLRTAYTFLPVAEFRGTRFSNVPGFSTTSVSGNRLPYAPEHLLNATFGFSHARGVDTFIEAVYVGSQFGEDLNLINPLSANGQTGLIPSYTIWNATFNYKVETLDTTFFVSAKNLFDRLYITDRSRGLLPGPPRGVQAGFKFEF